MRDAIVDTSEASLLTIGLVEHVELVRRGVEEMIRSVPVVSLAFSASDLPSAERHLRRSSPDVLVTSSATSATEAATMLAVAPHARLLVLVRGSGPEHISSALRLPAKVFLVEDELVPASLAAGFRAAHADEALIPDVLAEYLLAEVRRALSAGARSRRPGPLTHREHQVLMLLADGLATKQIARTLSLSDHTVKRYIANVFTKLDSTDRAMAVSHGIALGLIEPAGKTSESRHSPGAIEHEWRATVGRAGQGREATSCYS